MAFTDFQVSLDSCECNPLLLKEFGGNLGLVAFSTLGGLSRPTSGWPLTSNLSCCVGVVFFTSGPVQGVHFFVGVVL